MPIKVLAVDDSALMRRYLREMLADDEFAVETARDGRDGLQRIEAFDPDVVTLDINMPVMDGLTCLAHIMENAPRPVIMISSLTEPGMLATFEALELGAVDYIPKPDGTISLGLRAIADELTAKVRAAASHGRARRPPAPPLAPATPRVTAKEPPPSGGYRHRPLAPPLAPAATAAPPGLALIGVSTGGPTALEAVLTRLPADFPLPIVVAQHMPARFTHLLANRLNGRSELTIVEVDGPQPLQAGWVYLGRGAADVVISRRRHRLVAHSLPSDQSTWHPSVNRLVHSALVHLHPQQLLGVLLTGMGDDGAEALAELHRRGGRTIAEAEQSCAVYGMPKELIARHGASAILPVTAIAERLQQWSAALASGDNAPLGEPSCH